MHLYSGYNCKLIKANFFNDFYFKNEYLQKNNVFY